MDNKNAQQSKIIPWIKTWIFNRSSSVLLCKAFTNRASTLWFRWSPSSCLYYCSWTSQINNKNQFIYLPRSSRNRWWNGCYFQPTSSWPYNRNLRYLSYRDSPTAVYCVSTKTPSSFICCISNDHCPFSAWIAAYSRNEP